MNFAELNFAADDAITHERPSMIVGNGYNTALLKRKRQILNGSLVEVDHGKAPDVTFAAAVSDSSYDFERLEELSIKVKGSYGVASGSASYTSSRTLKINRHSSYLTCSVGVRFPPEEIADYSLTDDARTFWRRPNEFLDRCGNTYIKSVRRGGYFDITYEIHSSSVADQKQIRAKLEAAVSSMSFSASASAEYKKRISEVSKYSNSIVNMEGVTPPGKTLPRPGMQELLDFCIQYPSLLDPQANNRIVAFLMDDVVNISGTRGDPVDRQKLERQFVLTHEIAEALENFYDWKNEIEYVVAFPDQFTPETVEAAKKDEPDVLARIDELEKLQHDLLSSEDPRANFNEAIYVVEPTTYPRKEARAPKPASRPLRIKRTWWHPWFL